VDLSPFWGETLRLNSFYRRFIVRKSQVVGNGYRRSRAAVLGMAAATAVFAMDRHSYGSYVSFTSNGTYSYFADIGPQSATSPTFANDAFTTSVATFSGSGGANTNGQAVTLVSAAQTPVSVSGDTLTTSAASGNFAYSILQNSAGSGPSISSITNSNAGLGTFQLNTTYVLNFDVGMRNNFTWTTGSVAASLVGSILDDSSPLTPSTLATVAVTQANMNNGGNGSASNWYLESVTYSTGASSSAPIGDPIALEFNGLTNGSQGNIANGAQLFYTNVYFTATSITPEPASLGLMGATAMGLMLRRRRRNVIAPETVQGSAHAPPLRYNSIENAREEPLQART
jgi:hypothetical protein